MTPDTKTRIRNRVVRIIESIFNLPHLLILLAIALALLATLDFFDLGFKNNWPAIHGGLFYRANPEPYFSFIGNTLLLMAFAAALLGNREARRNTSFELRPYLHVEWISKYNFNDCEGQGIRNTCLVLVNNGNELMRNIKYKVWMAGVEVPVRNHSLITTGGAPTKVVYAKGFMKSPLGSRDNDGPEFEQKNDAIVMAERLTVRGTYEDVDGHTFEFNFESDGSQQSWFREMDFQHQRTLIRRFVHWVMKIGHNNLIPMTLSSTRKYYTVVISSYVIFQQDNKILLSRRCNTGYRDGEYSLPAGHIEEAEFAIAAAIREAKEEVGVVVKAEDLVPAHIMHRHCGDHERIDFFFATKRWSGELTNAEPEKCDEIAWFYLDQLPTNTIPYIRAALEHYRDGYFYSEFTELEDKIFIKQTV